MYIYNFWEKPLIVWHLGFILHWYTQQLKTSAIEVAFASVYFVLFFTVSQIKSQVTSNIFTCIEKAKVRIVCFH